MTTANYKQDPPLGYQQLAIDTAKTLTLPAHQPNTTNPVYAIITAENQACRWRDDGVAPTATVGYPLAAGAELRCSTANLSGIQFIGQTAGCVLSICYYAFPN